MAARQYHGAKPLIYKSIDNFAPGHIVEVPLRNQVCTGIVNKKIASPKGIQPKEIIRDLDASIGKWLNLLLWFLQYYPGPSGLIVGLFVPNAFPKKLPALASSDSTTIAAPHSPLPALTNQQQKAIAQLALVRPGTISLLHGETGSGKTRVYIELAKQALQNQRSIIILTPEIGLTPQLVDMFQAAGVGPVLTIHSQLPSAKRRDMWLETARNKKTTVVIGPRSALFTPVHNLGLIIIDEAHDSSYKQGQAPHYQTTRVAAKLAVLCKAQLVLGTATPQISDYYSLQQHHAPVARMTTPVHTTHKPKISVVNSRDKTIFKASNLLSEPLLAGIRYTLAKKQQALIFLNRRGTARVVLCLACNWEAVCPHCDLPLTYHKDQHILRCHICNYQTLVLTTCPACQSADVVFRNAGSKALYDELQRLFPDARIKRFDSDNKPSETLQRYYQAILGGNVDILVGTQMLAKGLDIPNLTFVGIPFADASFQLPDYTADEQTYQLISQVIGRAGRRDLPSQVVIQTRNPKNPVILAAIQNNWTAYYARQLGHRKQYALPPFVYLLKLNYGAKQSKTAEAAASKLKQQLSKRFPNVTLLGPAPAFYSKVRSLYRWQLVVKSRERQALLEIVAVLPSGWRHDIDPSGLL